MLNEQADAGIDAVNAQTSPVGEVASRFATSGAYIIGVDVGGTFTDAVCSDGANTFRAKAPTNPARFKDGVLQSCAIIAKSQGLELSELLERTERFGLGTTAVTNVLATRIGRKVGILCTSGFEDTFHAMRNHHHVVDGWLEPHWNPVPVDAVRGIPERIDRDGHVITPLKIEDVDAAAESLVVEQEVNAFAVSFLWSVRNRIHEDAAVERLRSKYPGLPIYSGAELHPILREYERTTLAVLNAFTADALDGVEELKLELEQLGLRAPILLLHSGGGAMSVQEARSVPLGLASSGPAAGAVAAAEVVTVAGKRFALCCDMGGTSTDVAVIEDGAPIRRQSAEIQGIITGQSAIDVESVGAGGGSIAWIDPRGLLRVGPQSARATPGPVCYGRGGTEPTVTDAMIILGYLNPAGFMGGEMKLDVAAAELACARLGDRIGFSALETAHGIREIALAEMSKALRARISSGGLDIRRYGIVAYGGSGSLFATSLARMLGAPWVLSPAIASVLSAYGAATADIRRERSYAVDSLFPINTSRVEAVLSELRESADEDLRAQNVNPQDRSVACEVDMRFYRQRAYMTLEIEEGVLDEGALLQRFRANYARQYGDASLTAQGQVELSTARAIGIGKTIRAVLPADRPKSDYPQPANVGQRQVWVDRDAPITVPVFDAETLRPGHVVRGPALVDRIDTTLWIPDGASAEVTGGSSILTTINTHSESSIADD